jgi:hypothetical protein
MPTRQYLHHILCAIVILLFGCRKSQNGHFTKSKKISDIDIGVIATNTTTIFAQKTKILLNVFYYGNIMDNKPSLVSQIDISDKVVFNKIKQIDPTLPIFLESAIFLESDPILRFFGT